MVVGVSPMTGEEFARQLGLWIWPGILAEAVGEARDDPHASEETVFLYLCSDVLASGEEASLSTLVKLYLDHFFIPEPVIRVAKLFWGSYFQDPSMEMKIREARFHGTLHLEFDAPTHETPEHPLLMVESSCFECRLVDKPLTMLTMLVSNLAEPIKAVKEIKAPGAVHQELTHDGPLAEFIEARVGQAYGLWRFGRAGMAEPTIQIRSTPRRRSFYGPVPSPKDDVILSIINDLADQEEQSVLESYPE